MPAPPVHPAGPHGVHEPLRLRLAVLDGPQQADEWRATFRDETRARLGTDPDEQQVRTVATRSAKGDTPT